MYAVQFYIVYSFWEKSCRTQKNFDHEQCKWCQTNHPIPPATSSWRLSVVDTVWNSELSLMYWGGRGEEERKLWEVQGTKMIKCPQHRNGAPRFLFCHAQVSPCRCIHTLPRFQFASCGFLCLTNPPGKKLHLENFFPCRRWIEGCRAWKVFTTVASKWMGTKGILSHHICSPSHNEAVQKTKCLLSIWKWLVSKEIPVTTA